jgi:hypothetical protein
VHVFVFTVAICFFGVDVHFSQSVSSPLGGAEKEKVTLCFRNGANVRDLCRIYYCWRRQQRSAPTNNYSGRLSQPHLGSERCPPYVYNNTKANTQTAIRTHNGHTCLPRAIVTRRIQTLSRAPIKQRARAYPPLVSNMCTFSS